MVSPTSIRGKRSEDIAAAHLEQLGYRIIERNFSCRSGEIDIIAEEEDVLCFVEVRSTRSSVHGEPIETVVPAKQARLIRSASYYLTVHDWHHRQVRFDVVGITYLPQQAIRLVRGAFETGWHW